MKKLTDQQVEVVIALLLRSGVVLSALVVLAGGICYLVQQHAVIIHYHRFHGEPEALTHVPEILKQAAALQPAAIMQTGLLLLLATPIARVIFSAIAFLREGDRMYVVFTLIVLAALLFSLAGSHGL